MSLSTGFILMPQIDCTWGVVVLKKSRSRGSLSFTSNGCENCRQSHRRLLEKWILF